MIKKHKYGDKKKLRRPNVAVMISLQHSKKVLIFMLIAIMVVDFIGLNVLSKNRNTEKDPINNSKIFEKNNMSIIKPPFRIVQIGDARTGSTFQFQLLDAIANLKTPTDADIRTVQIPKSEWDNKRMIDGIAKNRSFVLKTHYDREVLKQLKDENKISVFASSNNIPYADFIQDRKNLVDCVECEIEKYKPLFGLSDEDLGLLKKRMKLYSILRMCCGMQMSKYEILRLNGCDMTEHVVKPDYPNCEQYNLSETEISFHEISIPYHSVNQEINWAKPGDCEKFNEQISSGKTFNGKKFKGCFIDGIIAGARIAKNAQKLT